MEETVKNVKRGASGGMSAGEVEELVVKLAKEGHPASKIGIILRDQYGVPSVKQTMGKSMIQILRKHGLKPELPEDLMSVIKKAVELHRHLAQNRKDTAAKHALELIEGRINKLAKYYIRTGVLPADWRYEPEKAALLVR